MIRYLQRRLLSTLIVLFGVSVLVFLVLHLIPGDPVTLLVGQSGASGQDIERLRHQLGLDQPLYIQYWNFLSHAVRGDFGRSIVSHRPVGTLIKEQLPATLQLTLVGMTIAIVIGTTAGVLAAVRPHSLLDSAIMVTATLGVAVPGFWFALLLIYTFAVHWHVFPAAGGQGARAVALPALTLGVGAAAVIARLTRSSMLEVLQQDYITTARAKGLRERVLITRHGLRNALIPVVTVVGLQFGALLSGAVIVETVFARQGIGRLAVDALSNKDYPLVQGTVLVTASAYVLVNLLVDLLYAVIDPRVRYG